MKFLPGRRGRISAALLYLLDSNFKDFLSNFVSFFSLSKQIMSDRIKGRRKKYSEKVKEVEVT